MSAVTPASIAGRIHPLIPEAIAAEQRERRRIEHERRARESRLTYRIGDVTEASA